MRLKFFFIFGFLIGAIFSGTAQTDSASTVIDTVYVKESPVVIKKTFYLPSEHMPDSSFFIGAAFGIGSNLAYASGTPQHSNRLVSSYSIFTGKKINNWAFSIGLLFLNVPAQITYSTSVFYENQKTEIVTDTIDTFYQTVNGIRTPYYITKNRDTTLHYHDTRDTILSRSMKIQYLQIPFRIQHAFRRGKWFIAPELSLIPGIALGGASLIPGNDKSKTKKMMVMAAVSIHLGIEIKKKIAMSVFSEITKNVSSVSSDKRELNLLLLSAGIRLIYFFN